MMLAWFALLMPFRTFFQFLLVDHFNSSHSVYTRIPTWVKKQLESFNRFLSCGVLCWPFSGGMQSTLMSLTSPFVSDLLLFWVDVAQ